MSDVFPGLRGRFALLTTFRRDGRPVPTAVWFARGPDCLYVVTHATSGKVKRLAREPRVEVAPCTSGGRPTGPSAHGVAHVIADAGERRAAGKAISRRYFRIPRTLIETEMRRRGGGAPPVYLTIAEG